jgi:DNA-nicking Smr family endonuclease
MPKKWKPSEEDIAAFHKAIEDVKPLVQKKVRINRSAKYQPDLSSFPSHTPIELSLTENEIPIPVKGDEFIVFKQAGVSNKTLRKLRKGQYNVDAILDLHGNSVDEARMLVENFLIQSLQERIRIVLIIHGKGRYHNEMPILKNKLNQWLRETNFVLAFCSATPAHGSRGALYVLLKQYSEENDA